MPAHWIKMAIDLRTLRYFVAVVDAGSITRAADALYVAQPALSLQIKKVEEDMGVQLLERTAKGVHPTPAGQRLYGHATDILKRVVLAQQDVRATTGEPIGRVAVGMSQSMAQFLTQPMVTECLHRWPKLQLQIIEASTGYVADYLRTGHLDLGVSFFAEPGRGIRYRPLASEDLTLISAPNKADARLAASEETFEFSRLGELSFILPAQPHSLRSLIEGFAKQHGVKLNVVAEVNTIPQIALLVAAGIGHSIVPLPSVHSELDRGLVQSRRIVNPEMVRTIYLCRWADSPVSPASAAVEGLMVDTINAMIADGRWPARPPEPLPPEASDLED